MNKLFYVVVLCLVIISCQMKVKPGIESGIDACEQCSMIIQDVDQGAVAIDDNEELHTFCNPVCLILECNDIKEIKGAAPAWSVYLFDHRSDAPIPASQAYIVQGDFRTTMGYGLLAFDTEVGAQEFVGEVDCEIIRWDDLRLQYESPDRVIRLKGDVPGEPETFEVLKEQVVSVLYDNNSSMSETLILTGYDFEMTIPPKSGGGGAFIADRPGQGFTFQNAKGKILAMLIVAGDHTSEEAIYR